MPINFYIKSQYLLSMDEVNVLDYLSHYSPLPDKCPICNYSLVPTYIYIYHSYNSADLLCGCPRDECGSVFFAVYRHIEYSENDYELINYHPKDYGLSNIPNEVEVISPKFVKIYQQAIHAENEGLDLICGVGYRKALEYLIKDFSSQEYPDNADRILAMPLQQCVQKYIDQPEIKSLAERAVWLGNDETHYVRKWVDKDIRDLKNLIDLTVYFISMRRKAFKYMEEMTR
jgi:hypothetical protein